MQKSRFILVFMVLVLIFSGCNAEKEDSETPEAPKKVQAYRIKNVPFAPTLEVFGTLEPLTETSLSAEVSGTVDTLLVKEGDTVTTGQELVRFDTSDNSIRIEYQNALDRVANANRTLELTRNSAFREEENAQIAVEQAKISLRNAEVSDEKTDISLVSEIEAAKRSIDIAETNVEIANTSLENTRENNGKTEKNLNFKTRDTSHTALVTFQDVIFFVDDALLFSRNKSSRQGTYLKLISFYDLSTLNTLRNDWFVLNTERENLQKELARADSEGWEDINTDLEFLEKLKSFGNELRGFLNNFDKGLDQSADTSDITAQAEIASLQSETGVLQTSLETQNSALTTLSNTISDFLIQGPQSVATAELNVTRAKNELAQAEQNLLQRQASADVQRINTSSGKENAAKALEAAQGNLENVKEKIALQIQSVESELDAARNQLAQADLKMAKLRVQSPISGIVLVQSVEKGDTVSLGSPLFVIATVDTLILRGEVPVEAVEAFRKTERGRVLIENFREVEGKIHKVFSTADVNTRQVTVEIAVENPDRSIPANVFATASFVLPETETIFIPFESLIAQDPPQVFILTEQLTSTDGNMERGVTVKKQRITLGRREGTDIEVLTGLTPGDIIVRERVIGLKEGDQVQVLNSLALGDWFGMERQHAAASEAIFDCDTGDGFLCRPPSVSYFPK